MTIFEELGKFGVVPVIAIDDADDALPLADALISGGLPVAEITFRTDAARDAILAMTTHRPEMIVGAGTVITRDQVDASVAANAKFALAPGFEKDIVDYAGSRGLPFAPGIMTPSELQAALSSGCKMVKFFPAMPAGGPSMLKNIAAPFVHTGVGFNPTGGVKLDNLADWFAVEQVRAVGGTWIATRDDIASGAWSAISDKAAQAVARVKEIRSGA
ncbi:MAG: bifunctional 4-hydroxy-2-oxoglutarate aldolase/2-dehydro-3-deoxy-phosphogluconate aldolase [Alphaproteobacteria bacterium]|nr:bifunctional 4-hydroxy-2-oxoglutarate aldolase/2-dehydro-3-deoxy-phosphogluconate aldolase [Alphaproteobacteria bacterium]